MRKERKHYTSEEKVAILRRHLLDKVPVSDLCEEHGLQPTVFYRWQKELFENGAAAFQGKSRPDHQGEQQRIEFLEKKIQTKDEVLAELMAEHIALKKSLGEVCPRCECRTMCGTWWWISSGTGQKRPRSVPDDSSTGWGSEPASSTTGENAMGASMSTMVGFPGISGYSRGRNNP